MSGTAKSKRCASPEYISWRGMIYRCTNPNAPRWSSYGGRGISVCERWRSFDAFLADMGPRPAGTSIDRIDVNGNYEPGNCRWATEAVQQANRRPPAILPETIALIEKGLALRSSGVSIYDAAEQLGVYHEYLAMLLSKADRLLPGRGAAVQVGGGR